jgi:hypothetical protein
MGRFVYPGSSDISAGYFQVPGIHTVLGSKGFRPKLFF